MWLFVGIAILLIRTVVANLADGNEYYLTEASDDGSKNYGLDAIDKLRYENFERTNSEPTSFDESDDERSENRAIDDTIVNRGAKRYDQDDVPKRQASSPLATLPYRPEKNDEIVEMEQRRKPAFYPWGVKRGTQQPVKTIKIRRPVRVPFHSWGGKRDGQRQRFFNWGGKKRSRSDDDSDVNNDTSRIIDDSYPSENYYRYRSLRGKSSIVDVGRRTVDDVNYAAEKNRRDGSFDDDERDGKRESEKLIASGLTTTLAGNKRRTLGCGEDDFRSASLSLILCKIGQFLPSNR